MSAARGDRPRLEWLPSGVLRCAVWCVALAVALAAWRPPAARAQESADDPAAFLRQIPTTPEQRQEFRRRVQERIAALAPTVQPADGVSEAQLEAHRGRLDAWQKLLEELDRADATAGQIDRLSDPQEAARAAREIADVEARTRTIESAAPPWTVTDELVRAATELVQTAEARVSALAAQVADYQALLAGGFDEQRAALQAQRKELESRAAQLRSSAITTPATTPAPTPADPTAQPGAAAPATAPSEALPAESTPPGDGRQAAAAPTTTPPSEPPPDATPLTPALIAVRRERLQVDIARIDLALQNLQAEQQRVDLAIQRDQRLLTAWQERLTVAGARATRLRSRHGRIKIQEIEQALAQASDPVEQARLNLKLFATRARFTYFDLPPPAAQPGPQPASRDGLEAEISGSKSRWTGVKTGLELYPSETLRRLRSALRAERGNWQARIDVLTAGRAATEAEILRIEGIRQRAQARFDALAAALTDLAGRHSVGAEELATIESTTAAERRQLREAAQQVVERLRETADRSGQTLERVAAHVQFLEFVDQAIRWQRLTSRNAGVLLVDWAGAGAELRGAWQGLTGSPPASDAALLDLEIEGDSIGTPVRRRMFELRRLWSNAAATVSSAQWAWVAVSTVAAVAMGIVVLWLARRRGVELARRIAEDWRRVRDGDDVGAMYGVSARVDLLIWNMIGDLAIPALAAGVVAAALGYLVDEPSIRRVPLALLGLALGAAVLVRLIHHLFEAHSPPHRVIPCSDVVARHYRTWLVTFVMVTAVMGAVPLVLFLESTGGTLREAILALLKTGILAMLVLFLLPRRRVLGEPDTTKARWTRMLAFVLYPLAQTAVLALLVLELVGFGVLVSYVSLGLLASVMLLLLLTVVTGYVNDAIEHRFLPAAAPRSIRGHASAIASRHTNAGAAAHTNAGAADAPPRPHYFVSLLRALVNLAAVVAVCAGLLVVWDVPLNQEWLNARAIGLALLVVLLAVVAERVSFAAFLTLWRLGHLPEGTSRLFHRWARGIIVLIAGLILIAIAGWKVESLWTFFTTLLAMVAIGFVAVWSILSNLLATLVILIWKPFNVGEEVELLPEGLSGEVVDINFMYTILENADGGRTAVPNSLFAQKFVKRKRVHRGPVRTLAEQLEAQEAIKPAKG
ncbi:MAG: hypothetical protein C4547_09225 [Phycisphaerales bacterium]|nr:MAG: hypothetical protein C4547_09225 [Phycisphaerales bacterium]